MAAETDRYVMLPLLYLTHYYRTHLIINDFYRLNANVKGVVGVEGHRVKVKPGAENTGLLLCGCNNDRIQNKRV